MKTGNGRGGDGGGWPLVKEFIELAKKTAVVTLSPEQRVRLLEWARRQTLIEASGHLMSEAGEQHYEAQGGENSRARPGVEQPPRLTEGHRATGGRRVGGLFSLRRATAAR